MQAAGYPAMNAAAPALLRSFIHASAVPRTKAKTDAPTANWTEFQKSRSVSLEP